MKKIIVLSFVVFFLSIVSTSATTVIKETVIHDASKQIARKVGKLGWIVIRMFAPVEKVKIVEVEIEINGEIKTVKMAKCFQYFRFRIKSRTMEHYRNCVAVFAFCGDKWRLTKTVFLDQEFLDKNPENHYQELFWELHDLEPFEF